MAFLPQRSRDYIFASDEDALELPTLPMSSCDFRSEIHCSEHKLPFFDNYGAHKNGYIMPYDEQAADISSSLSSMGLSLNPERLQMVSDMGILELLQREYHEKSCSSAHEVGVAVSAAGSGCQGKGEFWGQPNCGMLVSNFCPLYDHHPITTAGDVLGEMVDHQEPQQLKVARYSAEERKERILRYLKKRSQRNFNKTIKYACRKTLADKRVRIRGRFAKNDEFWQEYDGTLGLKTDHGFRDSQNLHSFNNHSSAQILGSHDEEAVWLQEAITNLMPDYHMFPEDICM